MISALTGPIDHADPVPQLCDCTDGRVDQVHRRVVGRNGRDGDVPRVDGQHQFAVGVVCGREDGPVEQADTRDPGGALAVPVQEIRAGEGGDERIARICDELTGSADLAKTAVDDHADALGQGGCVLEVVGNEKDGDAEPSEEVVELRSDVGLGVGVECGERLVQQQHVRVAGERARERDPLAFTAGELRWPGSFQVPDREPVEVLVCRMALRVFDVLPDGQMREERVVLEDETDTAPVRRERDVTGTVEPELAG